MTRRRSNQRHVIIVHDFSPNAPFVLADVSDASWRCGQDTETRQVGYAVRTVAPMSIADRPAIRNAAVAESPSAGLLCSEVPRQRPRDGHHYRGQPLGVFGRLSAGDRDGSNETVARC